MVLKSIVNRILGKKAVKIHGHQLVIKKEAEILSTLKNLKDAVIIEIGSQREAGSTLYFSELASTVGVSFITVDLNSQTTTAAEKIVKSKSDNFIAVNDYGEKYLERFQGKIGLLYLDAFDIDGDWHDTSLRTWYKEQGSDLNDKNCWKMHLDCAVAVKDKIVLGGYIAFDDVNPVDDEGRLIMKEVDGNYRLWSGKGKTAIPYLIDHGFEIISNQRSAALLRKTT